MGFKKKIKSHLEKSFYVVSSNRNLQALVNEMILNNSMEAAEAEGNGDINEDSVIEIPEDSQEEIVNNVEMGEFSRNQEIHWQQMKDMLLITAQSLPGCQNLKGIYDVIDKQSLKDVVKEVLLLRQRWV